MKNIIINWFFVVLLSWNLPAQDNWYPTNAEIEDLDSVVMSRFKESLCFDSTEQYKVWHIFEYEFKTDSLNKTDFLDGSILSKIQKKYMSKSFLIPHTVPYHQQSLALWASNQQNPTKCRDSLVKIGLLYDIEYLLEKEEHYKRTKIPQSSESFISDANGRLIETWSPLDTWPGCRDETLFKKNFSHTFDLFKILKDGNYRIVFHIFMTAGSNYIAIDDKSEIHLLTNFGGGKKGIRKIAMEELVSDYWVNYDLFELFYE